MMRTTKRSTGSSAKIALRVGVSLGLGAVFALAPIVVRAADGDGSPSATAGSKPSKPRASKSTSKTKRAPKTKAGARPGTAKQKTDSVGNGSHPIAENVTLTPFPSHPNEVRQALAQNRRDQLADAEKAARAEKQEDRWQTVLFDLRSFDARGDAEACFWRVLAYYRLGEMSRARSIRQLCTFSSKEDASLDAEEALASSLQPAAVMQEMVAAGERPPAPVANPAPYGGAPPTHVER